jgi:hypothetical protein
VQAHFLAGLIHIDPSTHADESGIGVRIVPLILKQVLESGPGSRQMGLRNAKPQEEDQHANGLVRIG